MSDRCDLCPLVLSSEGTISSVEVLTPYHIDIPPIDVVSRVSSALRWISTRSIEQAVVGAWNAIWSSKYADPEYNGLKPQQSPGVGHSQHLFLSEI